MLVALYLICLVKDAATSMHQCHENKFLHHHVTDSSEHDNGFDILDNHVTPTIKLFTYSVEEIAILLVHNVLLIVNSQEMSNYLLLSLQESNSQIIVPVQQLLVMPVDDIVEILNIQFGQMILIYNQKQFQHEALFLSKHCSELPVNSPTMCNVFNVIGARINLAKFQRIILFKNAQDIGFQHINVIGALVNCFCLDRHIVSCQCDKHHTPLYIVITMKSSQAFLFLKQNLGQKVSIFIQIWGVSSIITLSGSTKYVNLSIYANESLHLIVSKGAGFVLDDCWEVLQNGLVQRIFFCCNLKHHNDTSLIKIENPGNSTIFLTSKSFGLGFDDLRIETIDYSRVINSACFDETTSCRRLVSYNSQSHIKLIDQEDTSPEDAQVKQCILVCAESNIIILCEPEELNSSYKLGTIKNEELKERNYLALIASVTAVLMILHALHLLWSKYRNRGSNENTYNEPEDLSESHYIDETIHFHHKKDKNESHIVDNCFNLYSDEDCSEYKFSRE